MSEAVQVALIAAVPATLAALAAFWQARRLTRPLDDVNRAVNHRSPGQRTLIETVDEIAGTVQELRSSVAFLENALAQHLTHHEIQHGDDPV